jgi:WYL domain
MHNADPAAGLAQAISERSTEVMRNALSERSQKQRDRLAYIEFRLWFLGDACRQDLMDRFGIAPAMATRDFTAYRELAPRNIDFDGRRKVYVPSERFAPVINHEPEQVLTAISRGFGDGDNGKGGSYLPCELPLRLNRPTLQELAVLTKAIHQHQVLRVKYHSFRRGAASREIIPHALVDSGLRWHTRVFDRKSGEFRDLVVSRIEAATPEHGAEISPNEMAQADEEWNRRLILRLWSTQVSNIRKSSIGILGCGAGNCMLQFVRRSPDMSCSCGTWIAVRIVVLIRRFIGSV